MNGLPVCLSTYQPLPACLHLLCPRIEEPLGAAQGRPRALVGPSPKARPRARPRFLGRANANASELGGVALKGGLKSGMGSFRLDSLNKVLINGK